MKMNDVVSGVVGAFAVIGVTFTLILVLQWTFDLSKSFKHFFSVRLPELGEKIPTRIRLSEERLALLFGILGITIIVLGHRYKNNNFQDLVNDFYANVAVDFISVTITIFTLDRLNRLRLNAQEKQRIIAQMGSNSNDFAIEAARIICLNKWHQDGSLIGKKFIESDLRKVKLEDACLQDVFFVEAKLDHAELQAANLRNAHLNSASLNHAILIRADLRNADLRGTDLRKADLYQAQLQGANLSNADLEETNLRKAESDNNTVWPDDFDVDGAGVIKLSSRVEAASDNR